LAIAQRTAAALGGELSVVSELGQGSTFTLRAPMQLSGVKNAVGRAAA
jgi:signal transduction histidine kinase